MMRRLALALGLAGLAAAGCGGPQYVYLPAEQATATIQGQPAARYGIPPEAPKGSVRIATAGLIDLHSTRGHTLRFIRIRMVVANNNDRGPWLLDTREQFLSLPGHGESRAAFVNTNRSGMPEIRIEPGEERTFDFYYPLPRSMQKASSVPDFAFAWIIHTPERAVAERTPFDRYRVEAELPRDLQSGIGPYWYYDRAFPEYGFRDTVRIERPRTYLVPAPSMERVR